MKSIVKYKLISLGIMTAGILGLLTPQLATASGVNVFENCGGQAGSTTSGKQICGATQQDDFKNLIQNIINTMLLIVGMIAVIMIVVGGIRYVTSNGDAQQTKSAKDTILYAVVGIIVAIMAYAIVGFVIARFQ